MTPGQFDAARGAANLLKFRGGWRELTPAGQSTEVRTHLHREPIPLPGRLGFGTYRYRGGLDLSGVPFIDTAETYGYGRVEVGLEGRLPPDCRVISKVSRNHMRPGAVKNACRRSLQRLRVERLWCYLIHWPSPVVPPAETVGAMLELQAEGLTEHWGVSNHSVGQLEALAELGHVPALVQCRYNPEEREAEGLMIPYCRERGIRFMAYSPLGQGSLGPDAMSLVLQKVDAAVVATNDQEHLRGWLPWMT